MVRWAARRYAIYALIGGGVGFLALHGVPRPVSWILLFLATGGGGR